MQKRRMCVLSAVSTVWQTSDEVQETLRKRGIRGYLSSNALLELFGLTEDGFVEMRKEVVEGANGGELVYNFRRKV